MAIAPVGATSNTVSETGHASSALSVGTSPKVVGWYLTSGTVVVPVGALGGHSVNSSSGMTDLSSVGSL